MMEDTNWLKQTLDKPLFSDLLWSRPENKRQAGKLLIIGGNSHGFAAPVAAYNAATAAGIGSARAMLPEVLRKALGTSFAEAEFAPNTPSGSFSRRALDMLLENAKWADGVLLAGDFGRNSETAVLLSSFLDKYDEQVTVSQDGLDYFLGSNSPLLNRENILSVINLGKLQKLGKNNRPNPPIRHSMNLHDLVKLLGDWRTNVITKHADNFVVASGGQVSTTPSKKDQNWQIELASYAAVWQLQNPSKPFEAKTSAVYSYLNV
jgi:NAD(P)H-hydrate repair Nnr-like enzyme with NAD(P)H-hydrate dehydratase domain